MTDYSLDAEKRTLIGKQVKSMRREGKVPAVIYGPGVKEPLAITLDERISSKVLRGISPSTIVTITVDGTELETLVRDVQHHILKPGFMHVDFLALVKGEVVRTSVSIELLGEASAVEMQGALLTTGVVSLEIEALPKNLPNVIQVDISSLTEIGNGLYVKDLSLPEGVDVITDLEAMVVIASAPSSIEEEEEVVDEELDDAVDGAEPEVIEKGRGEDGAE